MLFTNLFSYLYIMEVPMFTATSGGYNAIHPEPFFMSRPNGLDCRLLLLIKSRARFIIQGREILIPPNSALIIDRRVPYQYYSDGSDYVDDWLHFDCGEEDFPMDLARSFHRPIPLSNPVKISVYLQQLLWEMNYTSEAFRAANIDMLMRVLLNNLIQADSEKNSPRTYSPYHAKLQNLRLAIQSESYKNFTPEDIAASLGISTSYFQHLYKDFFHIPFKTDLINMRVEYAKNLILNTNLKMEQIARTSGYTNEIHFYRQFRAKTGMTPREFRQKVFPS